ncbi:hypothetical protein E2C01_067795 [Portunus trituberculatus]|uniref:Uncharacterized protein n=1 Tax=Portunus trituberculatus TaxID=210409 RepID=A0A5B7HUK9_PORTR|nr:hypothetical protein [Portunus trituberculatus]
MGPFLVGEVLVPGATGHSRSICWPIASSYTESMQFIIRWYMEGSWDVARQALETARPLNPATQNKKGKESKAGHADREHGPEKDHLQDNGYLSVSGRAEEETHQPKQRQHDHCEDLYEQDSGFVGPSDTGPLLVERTEEAARGQAASLPYVPSSVPAWCPPSAEPILSQSRPPIPCRCWTCGHQMVSTPTSNSSSPTAVAHHTPISLVSLSSLCISSLG